jgi:hypothetical protein
LSLAGRGGPSPRRRALRPGGRGFRWDHRFIRRPLELHRTPDPSPDPSRLRSLVGPGGARTEPLGLRLTLGVGSVAIAYAVLLALGLVPPTATAAAGAFALIGTTLFVLAWTDPEWAPAPVPRTAPAPSGGAPGERHGRAVPAPHRPIGARAVGPPAFAAPRPVATAHAATPGEIAWNRFTREPAGVLPVDLVPPSAESPFEALPGESYDVPAEGPGEWPGSTTAAPYGPAWTGTSTPAPDPNWTPVEHEAFHPMPPHLRPTAPPWKEILQPPARPTPAKDASSVECASCHRGLTNPPTWRSCTSCHRPFCGECAFRSRRNLGQGRCTRCRTLMEIEEPRFIA